MRTRRYEELWVLLLSAFDEHILKRPGAHVIGKNENADSRLPFNHLPRRYCKRKALRSESLGNHGETLARRTQLVGVEDDSYGMELLAPRLIDCVPDANSTVEELAVTRHRVDGYRHVRVLEECRNLYALQ